MQRLGFRRLLPTANILLFMILLSIGYIGDRSSDEYQQVLDIAHSAQAEGWQPTYIERPTPLTHLLAWSWNFPAMLFATPFSLLIRGQHSDALVNAIAGVYLIVMWYIVGLWFDRRRDPERPGRRTKLFQTIRWTALCFSTVTFLLVCAIAVARVALHQYAEAACTLPMLFWPLFLAYAARWEIVHSRAVEHASAAVA